MQFHLKDLGLFLVNAHQDCVAEKPIKMEKKDIVESRCSPSYIHDMMSTLTKNNSIEKLAEIDEIGFGFLRLLPNWSVKQAIMVHLAESYEIKPRTLILDVGNTLLNAELIGRVFGIPSQGKFVQISLGIRILPCTDALTCCRQSIPSLDDNNSSHVAIKKRIHRRTTTELQDLVYSCPMATESDRMEFRRYVLLVVMKMFLCPTTQVTQQWFDTAVEKYKLKGNKTRESCIFVMLLLQYDQLDNCHEPEPWLAAWTSESLEKKAQYIISEISRSASKTKEGVKKDRSRNGVAKEEPGFFREVPSLSFVGLGPQFGEDFRYFDEVAASKRKWWLFSVCIDRHWWLYAFEIPQKRLWVLDSMHSGEHTDESCDCGVDEFRKEIILDKVMGPHNSDTGMALDALDSHPVRRN
ncbi:hypothetical protein AHAS_Ahas17G0132800 [Arachis hypogaea]